MLSLQEKKQLSRIESKVKKLTNHIIEMTDLFGEHFDFVNHRVIKLEEKRSVKSKALKS